MKPVTNLFFIILIVFYACTPKSEQEESTEKLTKVKLVTNKGEIVLQLYNETPLHRDNFIKIVSEGVLDSLLFHRVIENFMIQGGDINSKNAMPGDTLGSGDLPYQVDAEFSPNLFHKKGVLAAARGNHPERVSSSTQFYITQGRVFNDSTLNHAETRINGWLAEYYVKHDTTYKAQLDSLISAIESEDFEIVSRLNGMFAELARTYEGFEPYKIPEEQREIYKTLGGTPHLDQNYTVFGEVLSGLEVVDSIAAVATNDLDRPIEDVRILSASIINE